MKTIRLLLAAIVLAACSFSASAGEIFRFGPRIGTEVNSMRLNSDVFNSDNRAGFTGGLMMEVNVPLVGIAFDLSVMYVHRLNNNSLKAGATDSPDQNSMLTADSYIKRDYIEIPLNFKYKIGLPIVGKVVSPYLFTGPSFAFLASKRHINEAYKNKAFDVAWNFGVVPDRCVSRHRPSLSTPCAISGSSLTRTTKYIRSTLRPLDHSLSIRLPRSMAQSRLPRLRFIGVNLNNNSWKEEMENCNPALLYDETNSPVPGHNQYLQLLRR